MTEDVSLPSGGDEENRFLEIKTWYVTEEGYDGGRVYISSNSGSTWSLLTPIGGYDDNLDNECNYDGGAFTGDSSGWQTKKFNLSAYRGEEIRLKFNFCSDDSINPEGGWYIDDVKIHKASDATNVLYFDDFERMGQNWINLGNWDTSNNPYSYDGVNNVEVIIVDESNGESLLNSTYNSNLVNHWKFDEGSSTTTYDSVTNSAGYLTSGASFTSGKFGSAVNFDGSNDYVYNAAYHISGRYTQITMSAWVKFDSFPSSGNYESLVNPRYDGDAFLQVDSDGKAIFGGYFYNPSGEQRVVGTTTMVTGVWYHLIGTWSEYSDKMHIYVNGTLETEKSMSSNGYYLRSGSSYNYFGRDNNGNYMDGLLDQVSIWSVVFTSAEIQTLFNSPNGGDQLYATPHFGGSDSRTNSDGEIQDLYFTTKMYSGSDTEDSDDHISVDVYAGLYSGGWIKQVSSSAISSNKLEGRVPHASVYNRNSEELYSAIQAAVDDATASDVIEIWSGTYKENVEIDMRLTLLGAGASSTIIDGRYLGSVIRLKSNADYTIIKNLTVKRSGNNTNTCSSTAQHAGIDAFNAYHLKFHHINSRDNEYGFNACYADYLEILYSDIDATTRSGSAQRGIYAQNTDYGNYRYNEITKHTQGIQLNSNSHYSKFYNNKIHNNTGYGIYSSSNYDLEVYNNIIRDNNNDGIYATSLFRSEFINNTVIDNSDGMELRGNAYSVTISGNTIKDNSASGIQIYRFTGSSISQKSVIENNIFTDNNNGIYANGIYSTSYNKYLEFKNNTFNSNSNYGLYCYYYCYYNLVENNTFIGDDDTTYGLYLQRSLYSTIGNNTFQDDHTSKDIYMYYCGTGAASNKFFNNNLG